MDITIPKDVEYIIDKFYNNGYEAFMVGGCIRDALLNKKPMDYDIATSAKPELTESLFEKTIPTGIKHGTVTILLNKTPYEVTTYRIEGTYSNNRKPDSVTFISNIKEDLARRDFTINAFAYNHEEGLIDYFSGISDLNSKLIRCVGIPDKRFNEDALRMLRAVRFSAQLNFAIEEETYKSLHRNSCLLKNISKERIRAEFSKIILSNNPHLGLTNLLETGLLDYIFSFEINISDNINSLNKDLSCRLASIFKNIDLNLVLRSLKELTFDNLTINKTISLLKSYPLIEKCKSKSDCKRLINNVTRSNIFDLISLYEVLEHKNLSILNNYITEIFNNKEALCIKDLAIDGNMLKKELNLLSGKLLGEILTHLLNEVLDDNIQNTKEDLLLTANKFINR